MKKSILLITILGITIGTLFSQSYTLYYNDYIVDDTVHVYGDPSSSELSFELSVINNTDLGSNIKVVRNELSLFDTATSYFNWVQTYDIETDSSSEYYYVPAGGSSPQGMFVGYYLPNSTFGSSLVEYTFYNMDNEEEGVSVLVEFNTTTDDIHENYVADISNIYPNPAEDYISLDYSLSGEVINADIKIFNLYGSVVIEQQLEIGIGRLNMDITGLISGLYFYSVIINGKARTTQKLIVR